MKYDYMIEKAKPLPPNALAMHPAFFRSSELPHFVFRRLGKIHFLCLYFLSGEKMPPLENDEIISNRYEFKSIRF